MQNIEDEEQMEDLVVNTILIFDLQMTNKFVNNNYRSEGFGMQRFEDDLSRVSVELVQVFSHFFWHIRTIIRFVGTIYRKLV